MSSVDELLIKGVRAFSPVNATTIKFGSPLTLIVGHNGCGKTTIIECLRYICTGQAPPGTAPAQFVHDPDLVSEQSVTATIQLRFRNPSGLEITATRHMSVTIEKSGSRVFRSVNSSTHASRLGQDNTRDHIVKEFEVRIPSELGVNKAVLDMVIFCHQEDSHWPLAKPRDVKEYFDQLFDVGKYTDAITQLKLQAKRKRDDLIRLKEREAHLKRDKDIAKAVKKSCEKLSSDVASLKIEIEQLDTELEQVKNETKSAFGKAKDARTIADRLIVKRGEEKFKHDNVESLKQSLQLMEDSDEALEDMEREYDDRLKEYEKDCRAQKKSYENNHQEIEELRSRMSAKEREHGLHEAQEQAHNRQIQNRTDLVKTAATRHDIRGLPLELDDDQIKAFMDRMSRLANDHKKAFDRVKDELKSETQQAQNVLNDINGKMTAATAQKDNARQLLSSNENKIVSLQKQYDSIEFDEGMKAVLQNDLEAKQQKLLAMRNAHQSTAWQEKIRDADKDLHRAESKLQELEEEREQATRNAEDTGQLNYLQTEREDRRKRLQTNTAAHNNKIAAIIGTDWKPETAGPDHQRKLDDSTTAINEAQKELDITTQELAQLDYRISQCRSGLTQKRDSLKSSAQKVVDVIVGDDPEDYLTELAQLESDRDITKTDADSFQVLFKHLEQCINEAEKADVCRTCTRSLTAQQKLVMVANVQQQQQQLDVTTAKDQANDIEDQLKQVKAVLSDYETWERLSKDEIPLLVEDEKKLAAQRVVLMNRMETLDEKLKEKVSAKRDVDSITKTIATIAKLRAELTEYEASVKELETKLSAGGRFRALEAIKQDIAIAKDEERQSRTKINTIRDDKAQAEASVNKLELEMRDVKSKLDNAIHMLREKTGIESQIAEMKLSSNNQRELVTAADKKHKDLKEEYLQAEARLDLIVTNGHKRDREMQEISNKLNDTVYQLNSIEQEVQGYLERKGPEMLKRSEADLKKLKEDIAHVEQEQSAIAKEVKQLEDHLRNSGDVRRSINDNLRFRQDSRRLEVLRSEIIELESHDAEKDRDEWDREVTRLQNKEANVSAKRAGLHGEKRSKDQQLEDKQREWNKNYATSASQYKEAHISVEVTQTCIGDLNRYSDALDKAILDFHKRKMEDINEIIEELWRKTYQGADVDKIMIKSESEGSKRSTYNYRVVMIKQNTMMDMRGRCSAGQKVLACIIIRLALAEVFGVNCGLIALDEPTTNLDRDNIQALATSLAELIKIRRAQANFQLIIITHDEEFLKHMDPSDYVDEFYRITRDDNQKSHIGMESISRLM